jgi:high-affinity iron transporter
MLFGIVLAGPGVAAAAGGADEGASAQRVLHMLDYVAVDYAEAVKDGQVQDQGEYAEQLDFVTQVKTMVGRWPARPAQAALVAEASRLVAFVTNKRRADDVARLASELRWAIVKAYDVEIAPKTPPDLRGAVALYAAQCAACHGVEGAAMARRARR